MLLCKGACLGHTRLMGAPVCMHVETVYHLLGAVLHNTWFLVDLFTFSPSSPSSPSPLSFVSSLCVSWSLSCGLCLVQLYPYHLQDMLIKGLRVTPFVYYSSMMSTIMQGEKSYDSLPNFTAADCECSDVERLRSQGHRTQTVS